MTAVQASKWVRVIDVTDARACDSRPCLVSEDGQRLSAPVSRATSQPGKQGAG